MLLKKSRNKDEFYQKDDICQNAVGNTIERGGWGLGVTVPLYAQVLKSFWNAVVGEFPSNMCLVLKEIDIELKKKLQNSRR